MSKPIHVVSDFRTHRVEMRDAINAALPRRNLWLGLFLGFASTIAMIGGCALLLMQYFGDG